MFIHSHYRDYPHWCAYLAPLGGVSTLHEGKFCKDGYKMPFEEPVYRVGHNLPMLAKVTVDEIVL